MRKNKISLTDRIRILRNVNSSLKRKGPILIMSQAKTDTVLMMAGKPADLIPLCGEAMSKDSDIKKIMKESLELTDQFERFKASLKGDLIKSLLDFLTTEDKKEKGDSQTKKTAKESEKDLTKEN